MNNPPDTVRNLLALAHALAQASRFEPDPRWDPIHARYIRIARLRILNEQIKAGMHLGTREGKK